MFSKQMQTKMDAVNEIKRSFTDDAGRKTLISYVKYPCLLAVKKDAEKNIE